MEEWGDWEAMSPNEFQGMKSSFSSHFFCRCFEILIDISGRVMSFARISQFVSVIGVVADFHHRHDHKEGQHYNTGANEYYISVER